MSREILDGRNFSDIKMGVNMSKSAIYSDFETIKRKLKLFVSSKKIGVKTNDSPILELLICRKS